MIQTYPMEQVKSKINNTIFMEKELEIEEKSKSKHSQESYNDHIINKLKKKKKRLSPGWMHETSTWTWCTGKT